MATLGPARRFLAGWPDPAAAYAGFFTLLAAVSVYLVSPRVDITDGGDGLSLLNFSSARTSFYPLFIAAFGKHLVAVVIAQCALYLASWCWLVYVLHRRFRSRLVTIAFGVAVANTYWQWPHLTALSESLTMTCGNVLLVALLNMTDQSRRFLPWVAVAGAAVGAMMGLRPAMWSFAPVILPVAAAFALWRGQSAWRAFLCVAASVGFLVALEAAGFYAVHDKRDSLAPRHLYAKAAMLAIEPGFAMPSLPPSERETLEQTARLMRPFADYLADDRQSAVMRAVLRRHLEGFVQFRALPYLVAEGLVAPPSAAAKTRIGLAAIAANPSAYAMLTWRYTIGIWSDPVGIPFAMTALGAKLPVFSAAVLNDTVPSWAKTYSKRHGDFSFAWVLFPAFALFSAVCLLLSLWLAWVWSRVLFGRANITALPPSLMLLTALLLCGQANVVFVCLLNCSGGRFLVPVFPFFALALLVWFQSLPLARRWSPARD